MGLLLALDLGRPIASPVVKAALHSGLLINAPKPGVLRFMPALNVSREEIDEMLRIVHAIIRQAVREA